MSENLNMRVPDGFLSASEQAAKNQGMTRTDYVLDAMELVMGFDPFFRGKIKKYAKEMNITEAMVIQNMLIKRFAQDDTQREIGGQGQIMGEFISVDTGGGYRMMTGEELYNTLKERFVRETESDIVKDLVAREAMGIPLKQDEKALLIRYRKGRAWLESDEYKADLELQRQIEDALKQE